MKFNILQQDFYPAVSAVARSCGIRSQLPVLGNILISAIGDTLKLSATNLEIGVVKALKAEIIEEGEVTVPAKTLVEMISNLPAEKVEFISGVDQIEISTPSFSSKINGISAAEFPAIPLTGKEEIIIDAENLIKSLPQVIFAAAADDSRPILTGILTEIKNNKLQFVATDGYRLAHKIVDSTRDVNLKTLIPRRTFEEIIRLISEDSADKVKISISDDRNQIIFEFGDTLLSSRLIEGQFPAWEKIIPTDSKAKLTVERQELLKAVKLASVFAKNEANIIRLQNTSEKIILTSEAKELGNQAKEVEAKIEGEEIKIAFNAKFLQDALSALNTNQVIFSLSGPLSAAVLKPVGEEGLQYIIMPVNLS